LDDLPVSEVKARITSPILRTILRTAPLMLDKVHRRLRGIMDYAVEDGLIDGNPIPTRRPRVERRHYPAVTNLQGVGDILRRARAADPCKGIARAHALLAFTAMRVSEVVPAKWTEFDFEARNWSIPRERMKRKDQERGPHVVPIPPALLEQLQEWKTADGEGAVFVCVAPRDSAKHITAEGIEKFYRNALELSRKHSPHSWRSAFSTICRDAGKDSDSIESQLDHIVGNKVAAAYDRAKRLELRRELMSWYEEMLVVARDGADVLPMRRVS
jgi:integrase